MAILIGNLFCSKMTQVEAFPGEDDVKVKIIAFGELQQPTYAVWRFNEVSHITTTLHALI